jgi:hypothetical protein
VSAFNDSNRQAEEQLEKKSTAIDEAPAKVSQ